MGNTPRATIKQNWFHIRYTATAPEGLPPVVQAERMLRYSDSAGTWFIAVWEGKSVEDVPGAACVLRVHADHVLSVTRHGDLVTALNAYVFD